MTGHVELVAILGHELQHAAEIAAAPWVHDAGTLARLYRRIGLRLGSNAFDTAAAQRPVRADADATATAGCARG